MRAMRATTLPAGSARLPQGPAWVYEPSWAGPRLLVDITRSRVVACDVDGVDVTIRYPELVAMAGGIDDALLDGTVVSVGEAPVSFLIADLLRLYGVDLTARSYRERRRSLDQLAAAHPLLAITPAFSDLADTEAAAREQRLRGVLAKRVTSAYVPDTTTTDWLECVFHTDQNHRDDRTGSDHPPDRRRGR
jgi:bifunctional non-homologous end joining protein LigD